MVAAKPPASLTGLLRVARAAPLSLSVLLEVLDERRDWLWFSDMVQGLFPEDAARVLDAGGSEEVLAEFLPLFEAQYFPLDTGPIEYYMEDPDAAPVWSWLRQGAPHMLLGIEEEYLHEIGGADCGMGALALLPRFGDDQGIRVAWLEQAAEIIPQVVLERIPEGGVPLGRLQAALDGTPAAAAAHAAAWFQSSTNNFFLDVTYEDGIGVAIDNWDPEVMRYAAEEWRAADQMHDAIWNLAHWLGEDLAARFEQLLDFTLDRLAHLPPESELKEDESDDRRRTVY